MKILEFVPVIKKPEKPLEGVIYLENEYEGENLAHKIYRLKDYQADYYVFHHQDLVIETPEMIPAQCERMRVDNVGVGGVIGTLCLYESCTWWSPMRNVVTVGAIIQGDGKGGSYPMLDQPGYRSDAVSVDGCFLIFSDEFINIYEYHDFGSWRFCYDVDACLQARKNHMRVAIMDLRCKHDSQGEMTPDFEQTRQQFLAYWKQHVTFPVIFQSEYR